MSFMKSSIGGAIFQGFEILGPVAWSTAITVASQDSRFGKIISGVVCTASGIGLFKRSGLQNKVCSFYSKTSSENPQNKPMQWTAAAVGFALTMYGLYNLGSGVLELITLSSSDNLLEKALSCEERLQKAVSQKEAGDTAKYIAEWDKECNTNNAINWQECSASGEAEGDEKCKGDKAIELLNLAILKWNKKLAELEGKVAVLKSFSTERLRKIS